MAPSSQSVEPPQNPGRFKLLLRPIGTTVYLMPPYILSDEDTGLLAERLQTVFEEVIRA